MTPLALADSLLRAGNPAAALRVLRESAEAGEARDLLLARCALRLNDVPGAIAAFTSVLARNPAQPEAASTLGALYVRLGWLDQAAAHYTKCLQQAESERLRLDLAVVQVRRQQPALALAELGRVLERQPEHTAALQQRALVNLALGHCEAAATDLRRLLALQPAHDEAWGLLGRAEFGAGHHSAAAAALREALARRPADDGLAKSLVLALALAGELDEAHRRAVELRPRAPARWQELYESARYSRVADDGGDVDLRPVFLKAAHQALERGDWRWRERFEEVLRDVIAQPGAVDAAPLCHGAGVAALSPAQRLRLAQLAAAGAGRGIAPVAHPSTPVPERLRVGYVLPHLGDHVVARILAGLLAAHDARAVEVHVAVTRHFEAGEVEARYAALPGVTVHDLSACDDAGAVARLRALACDVLVDLGVYNDGARPGLLAHRPAPVQVNWLGAPYSSGAPWLDYIVTDPVVSPATPGWCSEAEARLPRCYFAYGHEDAAPPAVPPRATLGLPEDRFLYSALNNPYKLAPADLDAWARILHATPGSLLLLKDEKGAGARLREEAARRGIDPGRLLFLPRVSQRDYLLRQGMPDLFLDTRGYGAHTTLAESLWMGVPGLSCRGDAFQNRVGASLLESCGLAELVAADAEGYEALAIALYHDRERLAALKARLDTARRTAAPFDMAGQARALERAFRHMRERFAQGLPPASFTVDA